MWFFPLVKAGRGRDRPASFFYTTLFSQGFEARPGVGW